MKKTNYIVCKKGIYSRKDSRFYCYCKEPFNIIFTIEVMPDGVLDATSGWLEHQDDQGIKYSYGGNLYHLVFGGNLYYLVFIDVPNLLKKP